jgi:hypothetical protein
MWQVVDAIGTLLGPLWPDWLDSVLDCLTSWPDMIASCGVQCAVLNTVYALLFAVGQADCSSTPQRILVLLTGLCE